MSLIRKSTLGLVGKSDKNKTRAAATKESEARTKQAKQETKAAKLETKILKHEAKKNSAWSRAIEQAKADKAAKAATPPPPSVAATTPPPPPPPPTSVADEIEKLGRLKEQGLLTEAEFELQKAKVLGG